MNPTIRCVVLAVLASLVIAAPAGATVYTVMPGIDPDNNPCPLASAGAGTCSLREALAAVNAGGGGDTIMLPAGNYPNIQGAEFAIGKTVTILGAGSATTTVNGSPSSGVFDVTAPVVATISDVTITGGNATSGGGVEVNSPSGNPALVMTGDAVINNSATEEGGGIDFQRPGHAGQGGTLTLSDSLVANNQVSDTSDPSVNGGGIVLTSGGTLTNVGAAVLDGDVVLTRRLAAEVEGIDGIHPSRLGGICGNAGTDLAEDFGRSGRHGWYSFAI